MPRAASSTSPYIDVTAAVHCHYDRTVSVNTVQAYVTKRKLALTTTSTRTIPYTSRIYCYYLYLLYFVYFCV